jgi:hypothetical protein
MTLKNKKRSRICCCGGTGKYVRLTVHTSSSLLFQSNLPQPHCPASRTCKEQCAGEDQGEKGIVEQVDDGYVTPANVAIFNLDVCCWYAFLVESS